MVCKVHKYANGGQVKQWGTPASRQSKIKSKSKVQEEIGRDMAWSNEAHNAQMKYLTAEPGSYKEKFSRRRYQHAQRRLKRSPE